MLHNNTSDIQHDTFYHFRTKLYVGQRNSFLFLSFERSRDSIFLQYLLLLLIINVSIDLKRKKNLIVRALEYNLLHLQYEILLFQWNYITRLRIDSWVLTTNFKTLQQMKLVLIAFEYIFQCFAFWIDDIDNVHIKSTTCFRILHRVQRNGL